MRVAIIPARGGSQRIPRKNIRLFHGKPIIAYSIETAKASGLFSAIWVSTEDEEIGRIAEGYGAQWYPRPAALAENEIGTQEVAADVVRWLYEQGEPYQQVCCIYPTAPTMLTSDIGVVYAMCQFAPPWQNIKYVEGWLYWGTAKRFLENPAIEPTDTRVDLVPHRWTDINTEADWSKAEAMYAELHK